MAKLKKSEGYSENYLATVVKISNVRKHTDADRLVVTLIEGNNIITGLGLQEGDVRIFFPVESAISPEYLKMNNEFNDAILNNDPSQKGYFSANKSDGFGRVRAQKFRGEKSEGYIVPVETLSFMLSASEIEYIKTKCVGESFDMIDDFVLCKKHIPKISLTQGSGTSGGKKEPKLKELLIPGQFTFHDETVQLPKIIHSYSPEDDTLITYKEHGSSFIGANVLIKRNLKWHEKLLKKIKFNIPESEYGHIYSSGKPKSKLPKGVLTEKEQDKRYHNPNGDFYKSNIWERAFKDIKHKLLKGISVYGELVGYSEDGAPIQGAFDYGCNPGEYKLHIYRINYTNVDGHTIEFTWPQVKEYCKKYDLETVTDLYYGKAKDLFPELDVNNHWHENFIEKLKEKYLEGDCYMCKNKVPAEGIVVSKPHYTFEFNAAKLKSFRFRGWESKELDKGVVDAETAESLGEEVN